MLRSVVAIVSGGASGLGAATASAIVRRGGRVIIADLPSAHDNFLRLAATACAEVHGSGQVTEGVSCEEYQPHGSPKGKKRKEIKGPLLAFAATDIRSEHNVSAALDLAEKTFGEPVNAVINCAGICPARKTISKKSSDQAHFDRLNVHPLEDFRAALEINTLGTFNLNRLAAERMAMRDADAEGLRGCIIMTASIAAFEGQTGE